MARYPAIKLGAIRELWKQQRYSPAEALRRQVERIEQLAGEVDAAASYPVEWVVFRVTGYRPDLDGSLSETVPGGALMADLPALAERLCAGAGFTWEECAKTGAIGMDALATKWGVSRKTVERRRAHGLVARRVDGPSGRPRLAYVPLVVKRHEERFGDELGRAAGFSRMSAADEVRILRRAARYRRVFGCSAHEAAARLAPRFGRSVEAIRLLISRSMAKQFASPSRLTASDRVAAWEAWRQGEETRAIAQRLGRTPADARRAIQVERARRLKHLVAEGALGSSSEAAPDEAALARVLAPEPARTGLGQFGERDLSRFVESARQWQVPVAYEERARAGAYQALRAWLRRAIARIDPHNPSAADLDRIETLLRHAARLKAELVRSQLPVMLQTLESTLGTRIDEGGGMTSTSLRTLLGEALAAVGDAVDAYDPPAVGKAGKSEGVSGRLAAPVSLAVTRIGTRAAAGLKAVALAGPRRAQQRLMSGVEIEDWTLRVCPWQAWLEWPRSPRRLENPTSALDDEVLLTTSVYELRNGWRGEPPMMLKEVAGRLKITERRAAELERAAIRAAHGEKET